MRCGRFSKMMKILTTLKTSKDLTKVNFKIKHWVAAVNSKINKPSTQHNQVKESSKVRTSVDRLLSEPTTI